MLSCENQQEQRDDQKDLAAEKAKSVLASLPTLTQLLVEANRPSSHSPALDPILVITPESQVCYEEKKP